MPYVVRLTCKTCCYKDFGKSSKSSNKRCTFNLPVVKAYETRFGVVPGVYKNADDNEQDDSDNLEG